MVRPVVHHTCLFRHSLARLFLCHLRAHDLFRTALALPVGTPGAVVVPRTAFAASQVEVHRRTLVSTVLRCTRCVVGLVGTAAVASIVAEVRMALPRSLPAAAGDVR